MQPDIDSTLQQAKAAGHFYGFTPLWRWLFNFCGLFMALSIIGLPLTIWMFRVTANGGVGLSDQGFAMKGMGTKFSYRWDEIEEFGQSKINAGGGLVGRGLAAASESNKASLKGPLNFKVRDKKGWVMLPAHTFEGTVVMALEMERRTGLRIVTPEDQPLPGADD